MIKQALSSTSSRLLFWLGIAGIVFYAISPIVFPGVENLRQPELLPVYTAMIGVGQLLKKGARITITAGNNDRDNKKDKS